MRLSVGPNRDIMELKKGGGCLMLFGLPFLLAGLFVLAASLGLLPLKGDSPPWFVGVPFGGVFALVGSGFIFGRRGVSIDVGSKTVATWWGALGFRRRKERPLDDFDHVTVRKEVRQSKNSAYTVYPVRLAGRGKPIDIEEPREYKTARATAEELAKFVGKGIQDSSSGEPVERDVERLDESLRDRARRTGEALEMPKTPPNMKSVCRVEGRQMVIEIPGAGFQPATLLLLAVPLAFAAIVTFTFLAPILKDKDMPDAIRYIIVGFISVFFVAMPLILFGIKILTGARPQALVVASPDGLRVTQRSTFSSKVAEIPADELEELICPSAAASAEAREMLDRAPVPEAARGLLKALASRAQGGIVARSDKATIEFGANLPAEELRWLHAAITKILTA